MAEVVLVCFSVRIMVLKSLSSLIRSRCFCMFSASLRTRLAIPESFPAYFCFRAKYWFFLTSSRSTCSKRPVTSFIRICSLVRLCSFQFLTLGDWPACRWLFGRRPIVFDDAAASNRFAELFVSFLSAEDPPAMALTGSELRPALIFLLAARPGPAP